MSSNQFTLAEAAERAGNTPGTLRHAIRDQRLAATKRGGAYFVTVEEIDRYIRERRPWHAPQTVRGEV